MHKLLVLLPFLITLPLGTQAAEQLTPGNWKVTVSMHMPGMPFAPPPRTIEQCITPEMAKGNVEAMVNENQQSECKMQNFEFKQGKGSWKVVCSGRHSGVGEGTITLEGSKHYTSETRLTMSDTGNRVMTMTSDAHWTGPCKSKP